MITQSYRKELKPQKNHGVFKKSDILQLRGYFKSLHYFEYQINTERLQ